MDLTPVTTLLAEIPAAVWGFFGGALVTLLPVIIANGHDRRERQRERLLNLRRDVYLPAVEAMSSMSALPSMLIADDGYDEVKVRLRTLTQAFARVELVATPETLTHLAAVQRTMLETFVAAYKRRVPMTLRSGAIAAASNSRDRAYQERLKCVDLMREYNLSEQRDQQRWETIKERSASARASWEESNSKWMQLSFQQESDRLALALDLAARIGAWGDAPSKLAAAIRSELDAGHDVAVLMRLAGENKAAAKEAVTEVIPMIEAAIDQLRREIEADADKKAPAASTGA